FSWLILVCIGLFRFLWGGGRAFWMAAQVSSSFRSLSGPSEALREGKGQGNERARTLPFLYRAVPCSKFSRLTTVDHALRRLTGCRVDFSGDGRELTQSMVSGTRDFGNPRVQSQLAQCGNVENLPIRPLRRIVRVNRIHVCGK